MIDRLMLMFIPTGTALGLIGAYMISQGTSPLRTIVTLAISSVFIAFVMVNIALDDEIKDEGGENNGR